MANQLAEFHTRDLSTCSTKSTLMRERAKHFAHNEWGNFWLRQKTDSPIWSSSSQTRNDNSIPKCKSALLPSAPRRSSKLGEPKFGEIVSTHTASLFIVDSSELYFQFWHDFELAESFYRANLIKKRSHKMFYWSCKSHLPRTFKRRCKQM